MARTRRESAADVMHRLEANPLRYLCDRFNKASDGKEKDSMALELLPYCYGKLRTVEHSAGTGAAITVTIGGKPEEPPDG